MLKTSTIYRCLPGKYAKLKSFSDYRRKTITSIGRIVPMSGKTVVDLGTGTGNLAFQMAEHSETVYGFDNSKAMVKYAKKVSKSSHIRSCIFDQAEHEDIPLSEDSADIIVIGWALVGYVGAAMADNTWKDKIHLLLRECQRVLKPNGHVLILETANLLNELPIGKVYHPIRKQFLSFLEEELDFHADFYSNDWDFLNMRNVKWAKFWFGDDITKKLLDAGKTILEECVGIWWKQFI